MNKRIVVKKNQKKINIAYLIICTFLLLFITSGIIIFSVKMIVDFNSIPKSELIMFPVSVLGMIVSFIYIYSISGRDANTKMMNVDKLTLKLVGKMIRKELPKYTAIYVNLKDFKYINDLVSTRGGDEVIGKFGIIVRKFCTHSELASRLGGDNFLFLISKHRVDAFLKLLSKISIPVVVNGEEKLVPVKSRCGIYALVKGDTISEVFNKSSMALNYAKEDGTIDYCWYAPIMEEKHLSEKRISHEYDAAIKKGDIKVYYQPKVNLIDNTVVGAEGLARWEKEDNVILPKDFLPSLVKNARILELDYYILEQVCIDISDCVKRGLKMVPVSVNFSMTHLKENNFAEKIIEIVNRYMIPRSLIQIELTESEGRYDTKALMDFFMAMRMASIKTAIDDFGIGFSSLEFLKNSDIDIIKIDKSFIDGIEINDGNNVNSMLLRNMLKTCLDMKKEVVCEGIEKKEQLDELISMRCLLAQGFYFDQALPILEFKKRLINPVYIGK